MITLINQNIHYIVCRNGRPVGVARLFDNPYHQKNCNVEFELERLDPEFARELFQKLLILAGHLLRIMKLPMYTAQIKSCSPTSYMPLCK